MKTVAESRLERKFEDVKSDYQQGKEMKRRNERIAHLNSKITEYKESAKDALDQNMFSFAKNYVTRIEECQEKINALNIW